MGPFEPILVINLIETVQTVFGSRGKHKKFNLTNLFNNKT